jgi:hypothetical protein
VIYRLRCHPGKGLLADFAAHYTIHSSTVYRILCRNGGFIARILHNDVVLRKERLGCRYYHIFMQHTRRMVIDMERQKWLTGTIVGKIEVSCLWHHVIALSGTLALGHTHHT